MSTLKTVCAILLLTSVASTLAGCAKPGTHSSVLPTGGPTMSQIYNGQMRYSTGTDGQLNAVRSKVPVADYHVAQTAGKNRLMAPALMGSSGVEGDRRISQAKLKYQGNQRGKQNQHNMGAPNMLPNPSIKMTVYPHFDGNDQDYIPAHTAYMKLYQQAHFALPGEAAESMR